MVNLNIYPGKKSNFWGNRWLAFVTGVIALTVFSTYTALAVTSSGNTLDLAGLSSSSTSTVAYSLRRLSSSYTGNLIQVRRSSDYATANIGYDGSGNLDVAALVSFVGSGDGYVSVWYDQSGNANNAIQASTSLQPKIVSAGSVLNVNGRPVIMCDGTTFIDGGAFYYAIYYARTLNAVYNFQSGTVQHIIDRNDNHPAVFSILGNNSGQVRNDANVLYTDLGTTQTPPFSNTYTMTWGATNAVNIYKNGVVDYTGSLSLSSSMDIMRIGRHYSITGTAVLNFWEVILFPSELSASERTALDLNQRNTYKVGIPTITSLSAYTGFPLSAITINGSGFNTTAANNIVYFGATKATVNSASASSLNVTVPNGATYAPVTVLNTSMSLSGRSRYPFMPTFDNSEYLSAVNLATNVNFSAGDWAVDVAFGDMDGDGKPDMVVPNFNAGTVSVIRNTSTSGSINAGSFATKVDFTTGAHAQNLAIGDIDGDGKLDIAVTNTAATTVTLLRNISTSGSITSSSFAAAVNLATGSTPQGVVLSDIDGDGKPELVVANMGANTVSVYRNISTSGSITTGSFATKVDIATGASPQSVYVAELDGDGKPDLAITWSGGLSVFRNISSQGSITTASFDTRVDFNADNTPNRIVAGDMDGDGKLDLVASNYNSANISVLRNTSSVGSINSGSFATKVDFATGTNPWSVTVGDLNGDGKPEMVSANFSAGTISVIRNTATSGIINSASFAAKVDYALVFGLRGVAIGDLDGDGRPDVAAAVSNSLNAACVFRNDPLSPITGTLAACSGAVTSLSNTASGGSWTSSNTSVATVNSSTGVVTSVGAGTTTISYTVAGGSATSIVTVNSSPSTITSNSGAISVGNIARFAGTGTSSFSGDGSAATNATINSPVGVTEDASGNVYVVDLNNSRIRKISTSGVITTVAGGGAGTTDGIQATNASLNTPYDVVADAAGNIYVAEAGTNKIRKINLATGVFTTYAGTGVAASAGDGGAATSASINYPLGIAIDGAGNLYVAERLGHRIRKISATTGTISTVAGTGSSGFSGDGSAATSAALNGPTRVSVDDQGNIYVLDYLNSRVRKVNTAGNISTVAGNGTSAFSGDNGPATAASIQAQGIAVNGRGEIFLADYGNHRVRMINTSGVISSIAGDGSTSNTGDGTSAPTSAISSPIAVAVSEASGALYVCSYGGNQVRKISLSGLGINICQGVAATLNNATSGGTWSINNGNASINATTGVVTGVVAGTSVVTYTLGTGCYQTRKVTVNAMPSVSTTTYNYICPGSSTTLTASGASIYSWSPSSGLSATSGATVSASPTAATAYSVSVTANGCTSTAVANVIINDVPTVTATAAGSTTICPGNSVTINAEGAAATALQLNGTSHGVSVPTAAAISNLGRSTASYTLESWVNYTSSSAAASSIIRKACDYNLFIINNKLYAEAFPASGSGSFKQAISTITLSPNTWYHVAATWNGTALKLYVNGVDVTGGTLDRVVGVSTSDLFFGLSSYLGGEYFAGKLDEIRIWNTVRTPAEIANSMNKGVSPSSTGLVVNYKFDEASGTTVNNAVGNGNNGTFIGSPTRVASGASINFNSYAWGPGGVTTSSVSATAAAGYSVTVTNAAGCSATSSAVPVTMYTLPTISGGANTAVCTGSSATLSATGGVSYTWSPSATLTSSAGTSVTATPTGNTTYVVTGTDSHGCVNTANVTVSVNPYPSVPAISGNTTLSTAITTVLTNAVTGGAWASGSTGVATVNPTNGTVAGVAAGTGLISYTVTTLGCATTVTTNVMVKTPNVGLNFDGVNDYVDLGGNITNLNNADFTIEMWVKTSTAGVGLLNCQDADYSWEGGEKCFYIGTTGIPAFVGNTNDYIYGNVSVTDGKWHHVAVVWDYISGTSGTGKMYVDGVDRTGMVDYATRIADAGTFWLGKPNTVEAPNFFNGSMDEVRVWNVARTQAQIQNNMNCDVATQTGLVGYYRFDQGTVGGTNTNLVAYDYTGNGHCGVSNNTPLTGASSNYVNGAVGSCNAISDVLPGTISGESQVCAGNTIDLSNTVAGGAWSSGAPEVATIASTGTVTGVAAGTTVITYTLNCNIATRIVTVNALPAVNTGSSVAVCIGSSTALNATGASSYSWSPAAGLSATSGAAVTAAPSVTTTYTATGIDGNGCVNTSSVTVSVNPLPSVITAPAGGPAIISTIAGTGTTYASTGDGGPATAATVDARAKIKVDASGNIYFVEPNSNKVRKISTTGIISTVAGTGVGGYNGDNIQATAAQLNFPNGLAIDASNNVLVTEWSGRRIRKINTTTGIITTIAGTGTWGTPNDGGQATAANVGLPTGIAVDAAGNIFYSEQDNGVVRKISTTGVISLYAGNYTQGYTGDGGAATDATLNDPTGLAFDASGNLYIADRDNHVVRKVTPAGIISTFAGNGVTVYDNTGDGGPATAANLWSPTDVAVDAEGNVCIASVLAIRKVNSAGTISTVAGGTWSGITGDGGPATAAFISNIDGITFDGSGNLYISEIGSIRKVTPGATSSLCAGSTFTLSNTTPGGNWSSSNANASVGGSTGVVTGVTAGTAEISYSLGTGCYVSKQITVNALPTVNVTPSTFICPGASTGLTATGGNTYSWSPAASLSASSGASVTATPAAATTYTVTGTNVLGCSSTATSTVSIHGIPTVYNVTGGGNFCTGSTGVITGLSASEAGVNYQLYKGSSLVATVAGTGSALQFPLQSAAGTYTVQAVNAITGCVRDMDGSATIVIATVPTPIAGLNALCGGSTGQLTSTTAGGTWTSNAPGIISVGSASGIIATGTTLGSASITYAVTPTCRAFYYVTFNQTPASFTGATSICIGSATTLTTAPSGGVWSSVTPSIASVATSVGAVTGNAVGTSVISYVTPAGCYRTTTVNVITSPDTIAGTPVVCTGSSTMLSNTLTGGAWTGSGVYATLVQNAAAGTCTVTGTTAGTFTITYSVGSCRVTKQVVVNGQPGYIANTPKACVGTTITLTNPTAGGAWSTDGSGAVAISASGAVTGMATGTSAVTYTLPTGCFRTTVATVYALPAFSGSTNVCSGATTSLTAGSAGTWTSNNTSVATVNTNGVVSGVSAGTSTISFTSSVSGCSVATSVNVTGAGPVTGTAAICAGGTTTLNNAMPGGTWSSSNATVATIGSATGYVNGLVAGTATMYYTLASGCARSVVVTVNALPNITSATAVCLSSTATMAATPAGGTWSGGTPGVATISAGGVLSGIALGTAPISYTAINGCARQAVATVSTPVSGISGGNVVCWSSTLTLSSGMSGGSWTSSTPVIAAFSGGPSSSVLSGLAVGTTTVSYVNGGCSASIIVSCQAAPAAISGAKQVCLNATTSLSSTPSGGTWSSSLTSVGSVSSTGVVSGLALGTTVVAYTGANGCAATTIVSVVGAPAITGPLTVCEGATTALTSNNSATLSWVSTNTVVATVNSNGVATGMSAGTSAITYTIISGCQSFATLTVLPRATAFVGDLNTCTGSDYAHQLTTTPPGGTWSSSNSAALSVTPFGVAPGWPQAIAVIAPLLAGQTIVTYTLPNGCHRASVVTVNQSPGAISGPSTICLGAVTLFSSAGSGGWSSYDPSIASVPYTNGAVTGQAGGSTTIAFTFFSNGCSAFKNVTVVSCARGAGNTSTGVDEQATGTEISFFPNPTNGTFTVNAPVAGMLSVYTLDGKEVLRQDVSVGSTEVNLPHSIAAGVYMCRFLDAAGNMTSVRMVLEKE